MIMDTAQRANRYPGFKIVSQKDQVLVCSIRTETLVRDGARRRRQGLNRNQPRVAATTSLCARVLITRSLPQACGALCDGLKVFWNVAPIRWRLLFLALEGAYRPPPHPLPILLRILERIRETLILLRLARGVWFNVEGRGGDLRHATRSSKHMFFNRFSRKL